MKNFYFLFPLLLLFTATLIGQSPGGEDPYIPTAPSAIFGKYLQHELSHAISREVESIEDVDAPLGYIRQKCKVIIDDNSKLELLPDSNCELTLSSYDDGDYVVTIRDEMGEHFTFVPFIDNMEQKRWRVIRKTSADGGTSIHFSYDTTPRSVLIPTASSGTDYYDRLGRQVMSSEDPLGKRPSGTHNPISGERD